MSLFSPSEPKKGKQQNTNTHTKNNIADPPDLTLPHNAPLSHKGKVLDVTAAPRPRHTLPYR